MPHIVSDGLSLAQSTGKKVLGGVGTVATGIRDEAGAVAHGIREHIDIDALHGQSARKGKQSTGKAVLTEAVASAAGAVAAFFISRLVRSRLGRHGR